MSETFRPARPDEVDEVARLEMHSFPSPTRTQKTWEEWLQNGPHGGLEALWVAEEDGRLVGACQLLWLRQWIGGEPLRVMGLAAVAIAPTHRRRGLAGRMLVAGFEHARERGDVASALYPFRASFYEELGYGLAGEAHQYQLPPSLLPDDKQGRLRVLMVDGEADEAAMHAVYREAARVHQTGQLERTPRSWKSVWGREDQAAVLYRGEGGKPEGYAIVRYRADLPVDRRFLEVEERVWLTIGAQRGIYAWLSTLGDQWRELVYRAHPEEGFGDRISEPRLPLLANPGWGLWFPSATLLRGPMFRLLDVCEALRARNVVGDVELTLVLEVDDEHIPENRGPWRVRVAHGRMEVEPHTGGAADARLRLPVDTLSRIYIGALAPWQAVAGGLAEIDRPELIRTLDHALLVPKPWTFDRF
ncbi:MAG TPA: GNAT family N-acetyltransferase [Longimicrobiaceae bacterium]|nr:GNAT family N-acetyltransferase [Longimicrobiaceae bacterium]